MTSKNRLRPREQFVPESFVDCLRRTVKGFRSLPRRMQVRLAFMIWATDSKYRAHRVWTGFSSYRYLELEGLFGRGKFRSLNYKLDIFDVTRHWSRAKNLTRGFRLKDPIRNLKALYLEPKRREPQSRLLDLNGRALRTVPRAIGSKIGAGITARAWRNVQPANKIPINVPMIKSLHARLVLMRGGEATRDLFIGDDPDRIAAMIEYLEQLLKMAHSDVAGDGFLIHRYFEASTGRIYAQGISLQTVPREIKKAALHGFYEYDFENCHYAIFEQMTRRLGSKYKAIRYYLENKKSIRHGIAERVGITSEEAKECLIGLMYGAKTTNWHENSIPKLIGQEKAAALFKDPDFVRITRAVRRGRQLILKRWPHRTKVTLVNEMQKTISLREEAKVRLAHLIQGVEAKALRRVVEILGDKVIVPMHDGFITKEGVDTAMLEREIHAATSYTLKVSEKRLSLSHDLGIPKHAFAQGLDLISESREKGDRLAG